MRLRAQWQTQKQLAVSLSMPGNIVWNSCHFCTVIGDTPM